MYYYVSTDYHLAFGFGELEKRQHPALSQPRPPQHPLSQIYHKINLPNYEIVSWHSQENFSQNLLKATT